MYFRLRNALADIACPFTEIHGMASYVLIMTATARLLALGEADREGECEEGRPVLGFSFLHLSTRV